MVTIKPRQQLIKEMWEEGREGEGIMREEDPTPGERQVKQKRFVFPDACIGYYP